MLVLAAFDPLAADLAPVRFAAAVAGHTGAALLVATVFAGDEGIEPLAGAQLGEELPPEAAGALDRVVDGLRRDGIAAEPLAICATSAPRGLELAAAHSGARLLVAGSAASSEEGRVAPGSTAARLLSGASCSVALVPRGWDASIDATVATGYVDTAEGRAALRSAHALARRSGARLRVLASVRPRAWSGVDPGEARALAEQAAGAAASGLLGEPVDVDVEIGEPAAVLLDAAAEADVLVCGSRGYGPPEATLLGGVTRRVTAEAASPVVVVARGDARGLERLLTGTRP